MSTPTTKRMLFSRSVQNRLIVGLMIAALLFGLATFSAFNKTLPVMGNDPDTIIWLLNIDFIILAALLGMIAHRIVGLWSGRRRGIAGSHLHVRLVYTFSILAAAPAIIMTVFSAFFFHFGVQTWFSERVSTAINESQAVAQAYLEEHQQVIRADTLAMASDLGRQATVLLNNQEALNKTTQTQAYLRNFSEAVIFDENGTVLSRAGAIRALSFKELPEFKSFQTQIPGKVIISTAQHDDRVRALTKLENFTNTYLYVSRMVDPKVLSHVASTRLASEEYADLQTRYSEVQISAVMIFVIIGLLMMMGGIGLGLILARQLVAPIKTLIHTANQVRAGDLSARVPDHKTLQEFEYLARAFNRMTKQIQEQQSELLEANRQVDARRRFTETILAGVSSGVLGIESNGTITLANSAFCRLFEEQEQTLLGKNVREILPGLSDILAKAHQRPKKITQEELPALSKTYLVRIAIEAIEQEEVGAIITFDDITALQSAQRKAAWSDVARRIAHEMKNPLTPIQLSAERLRRKYKDQIKDDPDTFDQCTQTIIRNVEDIGHMVNEFSAFARMPDPVMNRNDLSAHINETLTLHKQAHPDIKFRFSGRKKGLYFAHFDSAQIRQALNNIIQNAVDSVKSSQDKTKKIDLVLTAYEQDELAIIISDNGPGFPKNTNPETLTEPYVTHKPKGTGLGLAIVKKIMGDHRGALILGTQTWHKDVKGWQSLEGANVTLIFPRIECVRTTHQENEPPLASSNYKKAANI